MPDYDFHCNDCDQDFELTLESHDERDDLECPLCHSNNVERVFKQSAAQAFLRRLKSGGFGGGG